MLTVCTWLWGTAYGPADVAKLAAGVRRHLKQDYRFVCVTDHEEYFSAGIWSQRISGEVISTPILDRDLLSTKGCFARLRMFDPEWQEELCADDRIVCMDLDTVITGPLDPLFNRPETFLILQGANAANPCPFNGSLMMLRAGAHPEVWQDFSLEAATADNVAKYEFHDDQGWLWHKLPNAAGWKVGPQSGVYAFQKPAWPKGDDLPTDARLVVFPGWRSPEKFKHLPWVQEHWR